MFVVKFVRGRTNEIQNKVSPSEAVTGLSISVLIKDVKTTRYLRVKLVSVRRQRQRGIFFSCMWLRVANPVAVS